MSKKQIKEIESMLNKIAPEAADAIMNTLLYTPNIKGYQKGSIMTVAELKLLKPGDVFYYTVWDEDDEIRVSQFDNLSNIDTDMGSSKQVEVCGEDPYPMYIHIDDWNNDSFILDYVDDKGCGWHFTIINAIKKEKKKK